MAAAETLTHLAEDAPIQFFDLKSQQASLRSALERIKA